MPEPSPAPTERALFDQAMSLPEGADLDAFLNNSCAGNHVLRDRVASLVGSSKASAGFLSDEPSGWIIGREKPGQLIGHYRLEKVIGNGAFGVVWLAQQLQPVQRQVAIKILKLGLDTLAVMSRFEAERQALAVMDHPNVANVYDAGATAEGRPYFVMDYLDGEPLFAYAAARNLSIADRLALMQQVVAAVQHAHQKGIIHRDLKSSNILVVQVDGRAVPKVIDFGIAKMISATPGADRTLAPGSWGTPAYMSPEQLAGQAVDTRTDIFSLGIILYELLTGLVATRSSDNSPDLAPSRSLARLSEAELDSVAAARSTSPRPLVKELKGELDWIVLRAAAADPSERYGSADALNDDLALFQEGLPVAAGPPTRRYIARKFIRRHRVMLAAAVLVFATMFVATVVSVIYARQARAASLAMAEALYESHLMEARGVRQSGRPGQRTRALAAVAAAAKIHPTAELRDEAIAAMALPDMELIAALDVIPEVDPVYVYDFASDLLVVGSSGRAQIQRFRLKTGEELEPLTLPGPTPKAFKLCLSPGGEMIAIYSQSQKDVSIHEVATGRRICSVEGVNYKTVGCTFYDEARKLLVPMAGGGLEEIDLTNGTKIRHLDTGGIVYHVSVNIAGTQILAALRDARKMQLLDSASGEIVRTINPPDGQIDAAFSPDGRLVAYGDARGVARCQSLANARAGGSVLTGHRSLIFGTQFVLGGEFIVTSSWDNTARLWSPTGSQLMMFEGEALASPDGKRLLVRKGKRVQLLKLIPPREMTSFPPPTITRVPKMTFSADSSRVAICSDAGTILASFPEARVLTSFGRKHYGASFNPDGETLVTSGHDGLRAWNIPSLLAAPSAVTSHEVSSHSMVLDKTARVGFARSANGRWFAAATPYLGDPAKRRISVLEPATGAKVAEVPWNGASVFSLLFDPQSRWMAASNWRGKGFHVWETKDWKLIANPAPEVGTMQLSVNPDGSLIAACSPSELCLWDTSTWQCVRRFPCESTSSLPYPVDFSPDGSVLAYGYDPTHVRLVRVADGSLIATLTLPVHDEITRVRFSPDQRFLGVSSQTKSYFFDLERIRNHLDTLGLEMQMP